MKRRRATRPLGCGDSPGLPQDALHGAPGERVATVDLIGLAEDFGDGLSPGFGR